MAMYSDIIGVAPGCEVLEAFQGCPSSRGSVQLTKAASVPGRSVTRQLQLKMVARSWLYVQHAGQ